MRYEKNIFVKRSNKLEKEREREYKKIYFPHYHSINNLPFIDSIDIDLSIDR